jgi:ribosomal-protein-alanine N-acetyltransferase
MDERGGDPLVGVAGLLWAEGHGPDVEVAYLVRHDRWGRGYATEAAAAALGVGFGALGLERIVALAWPENDASRRVMEKIGMRPAGTATAYGREMTRHVAEAPRRA